MNEELLRHLLNLKISLARNLVKKLPESVQKPVKEVENQMMRVLYEVSKEYVEKGTTSENTKQASGLKVIDIE